MIINFYIIVSVNNNERLQHARLYQKQNKERILRYFQGSNVMDYNLFESPLDELELDEVLALADYQNAMAEDNYQEGAF